MFYQKPNGFRSSIRAGAYNQNGFRSKPRFNGGFNKQRSFQGSSKRGAHESKLRGQIDIFIKKAKEQVNLVEENIRQNFSEFNIADYLKVNIQNKGYSTPTPIQLQAIPPILEGRDLIGLANTGTGKTAAFLIPILNKIFKDRTQRALIITPTRELAVQINEEARAFSQNMSIYSALLIGGSNMHRQISDLRKNPHIVIGTPGRLKDLIQRKMLNLANFSIFVLDEVDLMVDIGFINDVKYFISLLPTERQSLFFSATIPPKVQELLADFVKDPVTVSVKQQDTAENIDQDVVKVNGGNKIDKLHDLLNQDSFEKVLVFGRTKHGIEKLDRNLTDRGFKVGSIHGNRTQGQRQRILKNFKQDEISILLATDVASRGLDIDNVSHVINYDLPKTYDEYVHRIGRTGRANKMGKALTFVE